MHLKLNPTDFEEHQAVLVRELVETIKIKLQGAGLDGDKLEETTASIAFSIASLIDGAALIEAPGIDVHPYLTFRTSDTELTHCGENSNAHELVYDMLKELFGS